MEAVLADSVDSIDQGGCKLFEVCTGSVGCGGDMANFAARFVQFAVQMEENVHVIIIKRISQVDECVMRVLTGATQNV